jgi:hypothetical protein
MAITLRVGQVYRKLRRGRNPCEITRRIVAICSTWVVYSKGTDRNGYCRQASFERWAQSAILIHEPDAAADKRL